MSCPEGKHELRAILPKPSKAGDIVGHPPETKEEPAWCKLCGALWCQLPFDMGWGWAHPVNDADAPTLLNVMRKHLQEERKVNELPLVPKLEACNDEILRVWLTGPDDEHRRMQMVIDPLAFYNEDDLEGAPGNWGIALADLARHVSNSLHDARGLDVGLALSRIQTFFNAELATPTDDAACTRLDPKDE